MTALEMHSYLSQLHAERALALSHGASDGHRYLADLDEEIAWCRTAYVGAAVTEIATLRAELFGPQIG